MADQGHVFRRALSWLPSQFATQPGTPRRFSSIEHLSAEAIAAFVDGELRMTAHLRAGDHLALCPECAAAVEHQNRARSALRDSQPIRIPSNLLGLLSQIPDSPMGAPATPLTGQSTDGDPQERRKRR